MAAKMKPENKRKLGYGTGSYETWKPWTTCSEFNSLGTTSNLVDWKHGRSLQLLSQAELYAYYLLRWDDEVEDIREHYPLKITKTKEIARKLQFRHPYNGREPITSDFYIVKKDGSVKVVAVFESRKALDDIKTLKRVSIEKYYWLEQGIPWEAMFKEDINLTVVNNLRICLVYYSPESVHDYVSLVKHLIATKQVKLDLTEPIVFGELGEHLEKKGVPWKNYLPSI